MEYLTVGEVAKALKISSETIRHYVNEGLLFPKKDEGNSYFYYSSEDVLKITDILFYRSMGLTIQQIKIIMNNLPLNQIGDVIEKRKGELIAELNNLIKELSILQEWDDKYRQEIKEIGDFSVGTMPVEYKYPGFLNDDSHLAEHIKQGFSLEKEQWGNVSVSFYVNTHSGEARRYLALGAPINVRINDKYDIKMEEFKADKSISTEVIENKDMREMIKPILKYAEDNGYELTGEFFGRENTNFFVENKRFALYKVYGIIK